MRIPIRSRPRPARQRPWLERLEDRTLFTVQPTPLSFTAFQTAHVAGRVAEPDAFDLYRVRLGRGDVVNAAVRAQADGSGLQSVLRVFDPAGRPVALDDQEGGDARLTFQASAAGDYLVGVSSAGDDAYDLGAGGSGHGGATTGLYALDLTRTPGAALKAGLAGNSFRLATVTAAYGDTLSGTFAVENRGGAGAGAFVVEVVLSGADLVGPARVLTTFSVSGLGAGQAFSPGPFTVTLPDLATATAAGLPVSGPVSLGLRIDPAGVVPELNPVAQVGVHRGEDWEALTVVTPVIASGNNHSRASADVLPGTNSRASGRLAAGQTDWYQLTVPTTGRLTAVAPLGGSSLVPRLTLAGPDGKVLIQSDGAIVQYLPPGTYALSVSAASGDGDYRLTSNFCQANSPFDTIFAAALSLIVADVNNDGIPDLLTANYNTDDSVTLALGNGDGTFGAPKNFPTGAQPDSLAVADVNGDGKPDLVVDNFGDNNVSVLLGNGDGTFQPQKVFPVGQLPSSVAVADVNGDGKPDVISANQESFSGDVASTVRVLLGNSDGTFQTQQTFAIGVGKNNISLAVVDVNGDGKPDIITANYNFNPDSTTYGSVSVLLGNGDGTFQPQRTFAVSSPGYTLAVADVNGDGKPDIITVNHGSPTVGVLLGNGDGTFQTQQTRIVSDSSRSVAVADVNDDGIPDIVSDGGGVLLGNGDGTFRVQGAFVRAIAVADFNGDGKPDIVVQNAADRRVSVLLGNGDGTFETQQASAVGPGNSSMAVADVNGDGKPDIVSANSGNNTVSVLLGNGDGTFQPQKVFPLGQVWSFSSIVAVADVNSDGKPDLVLSHYVFDGGDNFGVSVLLGNGDGTFRPLQPIALDHRLGGWTELADVNGDGKPDLVVLNRADQSVSVLLDNGDGTFQPPKVFPVGRAGQIFAKFVVADVNGDGKPDLVLVYGGDFLRLGVLRGNVGVWLGNGDGTFRLQQTFPLEAWSYNFVAADVNGDGKPDLVLGYGGDLNNVGVRLGNGDGSFRLQEIFAVDSSPNRPIVVAAADVNGDGKPDLVIADQGNKTVSVRLGNGDGTFQPRKISAINFNFDSERTVPSPMADVNGDGKPDLVVTRVNGRDLFVSVLQGKGDGTFTPTSPNQEVGSRNTPYLARLHEDGLPDSVVLDRRGNVVFRKGLPGDDLFAPPVTLNPGRPARDLTVLHTSSGPAVATADASFDPTLSGPNHFVYTVSVNHVLAGGQITRATAFSSTLVPTRVAAADLTGGGLDDLVVANSFDDSLQIAFQQPDGTFGAPLTLPTGENPSDLSLADVNGDGLTDITVSNQTSGDVSVFLNDKTHSFTRSYRFRAGTGLYGLDTTAASPAVSTLEQSVSLAAGDFTGAGRNDVVVVNRGSESFTVLPNDGAGGFGDPRKALTSSTSNGSAQNSQAGPVVAGDFNGDGRPDLALLMEDRAEVWVYTGDGRGHFTHSFTAAAGTTPTGLSLVRNPRTGLLDLLVGNPFGDVLHLQGKGDGTFQAPGSRVSLSVQDLGNGRPAVLVANQQTDRVTVQAPLPGSPQFVPVVTLADGTQSTLAPGAVQWAKLDKGSPYFDAVVLASGGNAMLVYRGTGFDAAGRPTFAAPVSTSVGTDPVGLTVQDLNGDGVPDMLVADRGSNDVAVLFGSLDKDGHWAATAGPRLASGGQGPVATTLRDLTGDGVPDLVVTNGQGGTFAVLPGVGQGFFNDTSPQVLNVPGNPLLQAPSYFGSSGRGVAVTGDGRLIGFDLDNFAASVRTLFAPPDGAGVDAAEALADGHVVAALATGAVVELAPSGGGLAVARSFTSLTGIPSDPSALAVLQGEAGLQVLVTTSGGDRVFVFGIPGLPESPPLPPAEAPTVPTVEVTPPSEGSLTLIVTLVSGPLPAAGPLVVAGGPVADVPAADAPAAAVAVARGADPTGGGGEDEDGEGPAIDVPGDGRPGPSQEGIDVQEQLRKIELYQPTPNPDRKGPMSWRLPERGEEFFAASARVADVVFALPPATWDGECARVLALALLGSALCPCLAATRRGALSRRPADDERTPD